METTGWARRLGPLLAGQVISTLGTSVYLVALVLMLKEISDSPALVGLMQFAAHLPIAILAPLAGRIVDGRRKLVIVGADLVRGIVMVLLFLATTLAGGPDIALLLAATTVSACASALFNPAVLSSIPDLVGAGNTRRGNAARAAVVQTANLAGSGLGGLFFVILGGPIVILLNGFSFLISAAGESFLRIPGPEATQDGEASKPPLSGGVGSSRPAGVSDLMGLPGPAETLRGNPSAGRLVLLNALVNFVYAPLVVMLPFLLENALGLSPALLGPLFGVALGGGVLAYLVQGGRTIPRRHDRRILRLSLGLLSAGLVLSGLFLHPAVLFVAVFLVGGAVASINLTALTMLSYLSRPGRRARTYALFEAAGAFAAPLAYGAGGALGEALLPRPALLPLLLGIAAAGIILVVPRKDTG